MSAIQPAPTTTLAIADCDIHPRPRQTAIGGVSASLHPYLPQRWRDHIAEFGVIYRQPWQQGTAYPKGQPQACRRDAWPDGDMPGSDLGFMAAQHLDPNKVALGILNPLTSGQGAQNPELSAALTHATNDWQMADGPRATGGCAGRWWCRMKMRRRRCGRSNAAPATRISPRCCC